MKEKIVNVLSTCPKLISPFDIGLANIDLISRTEAIDCLRLHMEALDERAKFLERQIAESMGRTDPYRVTFLFEMPLAQLEAERECVERLVAKLEQGVKV